MFAVFGYGSPGYEVAFLFKDVGQFFVGERAFLRFAFDTLLQDFFDFAGRDLFAGVGLKPFGEERFEVEDTEGGLDVLAVHYP